MVEDGQTAWSFGPLFPLGETVSMGSLLRPILMISFVLLIPVIPFLLFGDILQKWVEVQLSSRDSSLLIIALLCSDIFLPIPASVVCTFGGAKLGIFWGTITAWLGMGLGAILGFCLSRYFGQAFALKFSAGKDLARAEDLTQRCGPSVLILCRGVPVLAEASVLLMGMQRLSWQRFLVPVLLSNLGLAIAYSAFGEIAEKHQWLPLALAVSIGLPVVLAAIVKWSFESRINQQEEETT